MTKEKASEAVRNGSKAAKKTPSLNELMGKMDKTTKSIVADNKSMKDFTAYLKYVKDEVVVKKMRENDKKFDSMLDGVVDVNDIYDDVGKFADHLLHEKVAWVQRKIAWKPHKEVKNFGFVSCQDMLLRYRDLKDIMEFLKSLNGETKEEESPMLQEQRNLSLISEKLDELRYRANLSTVASVVASRVQPNDLSAGFCSLPALLCGLIFHPDTSDCYASVLLRLCKQLLVVSEAMQYEKDPKNDPIVTSSGVLNHPSARSVVPSLYIPIACGNGETGAPEEQAPLVAQDSAHIIMSTANGEVIAPSEVCMPVAKDSAMTLNLKEPPKPFLVIDTNGEKISMSVKENCEPSRK